MKKLRTSPSFKTEARVNSKMAYQNYNNISELLYELNALGSVLVKSIMEIHET